MTGTGISLSVNRAFKVIGLLFLVGGLLLYFDPDAATGVVTVQGSVDALRIEKVRPLGFEHIPVDSEDPEHASIPVNINLFASVSYSYNGIDYRGDIVSWGEPRDWEEGKSIELYLIEGEYDIPLDYFPAEAVKGKQDAFIVGIVAPLAGLILMIAGFLSEKGDRARALDRARRSAEKKIRGGVMVPAGTGKILDVKHRGNLLMGILLLVLGGILILAMGFALTRDTALYEKLISAFPLLMGAALIYLGLGEFGRERIIIESGSVQVMRRLPGKRMDRSIGLNTFAGIGENELIRGRGSLIGRHSRELVLLHEDPDFSELSLMLVPFGEKGQVKAEELAGLLGLPLTESV